MPKVNIKDLYIHLTRDHFAQALQARLSTLTRNDGFRQYGQDVKIGLTTKKFFPEALIQGEVFTSIYQYISGNNSLNNWFITIEQKYSTKVNTKIETGRFDVFASCVTTGALDDAVAIEIKADFDVEKISADAEKLLTAVFKSTTVQFKYAVCVFLCTNQDDLRDWKAKILEVGAGWKNGGALGAVGIMVTPWD